MSGGVIAIIVLGFLLILLGLAGLLYYLYSQNWPVHLDLTNNGSSQSFDLYVDGFYQGKYILPKGQKTALTIDSNTKNLRTGGSITRNQLRTIAIEFQTNMNVSFEPGNLPSNYTIVLSKDQAGYAPVNENDPNPGKTWTQKGFYVINLPSGVKVF